MTGVDTDGTKTVPDHKEPLPEAQAAALAELRATLPSSVDAQLVQGGEEGLTDATLLRWLVARKWHVAHAARDLAAHAEWRIHFTPEGRVPEEAVREILDEDKLFIQPVDRQGRSVTLLLVARHIARDGESAKRFLAYCLDAAIKANDPVRNPTGKLIGIFDLEGFGIRNYDLAALRGVFDMLQNHYVERLGTLFIMDAPVLFMALWKIVRPFVDPVTAKKVVFLSRADAHKVFAEQFDSQVLPPEYGGTGVLVSAEEVWRRVLAKQAGQQQQQQKQMGW